MKWIRFAALTIFTAVIQSSMLLRYNIKPDPLLILLVFFAVYTNTTDAIIASFAIGFCSDLIGTVMGPSILSYTIFGTALAYMHRVIAIRKMPSQAAAIFLTVLLAATFSALLALMKNQSFNLEALKNIFWIAICSAFIGPLLFLPFAWWMRINIDRFARQ